ncbi:hypothetical protein PoB_005429100 [Plakobranchus ocellatus]|uniref:Uncharacterized protein n=1 Tax=Plakobranchus ocellatus TaxID=259542 RepID=A0AAV4C4Y2_9GAST|nr:hypothetical protein PoB_005429100 [Plakobranchus ocellatus]
MSKVETECGQSGLVSPPHGLIFAVTGVAAESCHCQADSILGCLETSALAPVVTSRASCLDDSAKSIHGTRVRSVSGCGKPLSSLQVCGCGEQLVLPSPGCGGPPSVQEAEGVRLWKAVHCNSLCCHQPL